MKTIALKDKTFSLIRELKEKHRMKSFDSLIIDLIFCKQNVQEDMFGSLKGKAKSFTRKEREEIMGDDERWR